MRAERRPTVGRDQRLVLRCRSGSSLKTAEGVTKGLEAAGVDEDTSEGMGALSGGAVGGGVAAGTAIGGAALWGAEIGELWSCRFGARRRGGCGGWHGGMVGRKTFLKTNIKENVCLLGLRRLR